MHSIGSTFTRSNRINVVILRKYSFTTILLVLLQISTSLVVSGIRHIPPVHVHDVLTSDLSLLNNRVLPAEIEVENLVEETIPKVEEKVESWEDDDDDISAVDNVSKAGEDVISPANTAIPEGESTLVEKDIVEDTMSTPVDDNAVKQQQWPDDDDDTNVSVNNDSGVLNSVNNTSVVENNIPAITQDEESGEKPTIRDKIKQKMGWNDDDDDTIHEELTVNGINNTSENSVEGEENNISGVRNEDLEVSDSDGEDKKEGTVSEWPEDDDDDKVSVNNAASISDEQEDISLATAAADDEEKKSSLLSTFKKVAGWDNGDEKEGTEEENSTPEATETRDSSLLDGIGEEDEIATEAEMEKKEQVPSEWTEDDDDDNVAVDAELTNVPQSDNNTQNIPEAENEIFQDSSESNVKEEGDVDELLGDIFDTSPEATAYHRNQSSQGDGSDVVANEVKEEVVEGVAETPNENVQQEVVGGDIQGKTEGAAYQSETPETVDNGENATPTEDAAAAVDPNEVMIPNQQEEQQQQSPIQTWDDDDDVDASFLGMVQSTFNVLLLAVLLTSLLVLRKRVMDRVHTDGSSVPEAIKDELIDVVIRFASWSASVLTGTQNDSNNSTEDDTNERQNSRGNETIPLAADEEWGWEDEENQFGTELSGMGRGNEEKEDDDLAMAIAMSLSESQKGDEKKATISSSSSSSKSNYNQQPQRQSSSTSFSNKRTSPQLTSTPPPPPSSSGGGDSIEDLLGQMGGSNKITSFGQKPKTKPKSAKKQQGNNDDDLFASMGLSSIPKPTPRSSAAPTSSGWKAKQTIQQSAPKSAPTPSLVADSFGDDGGGDDWGDDGDLDDLLDD